LLENGTAFVKEELRNSTIGQKYTVIENKAKGKKKGLHRKDVGNKRSEDLSQSLLSKSRLNAVILRRS